MPIPAFWRAPSDTYPGSREYVAAYVASYALTRQATEYGEISQAIRDAAHRTLLEELYKNLGTIDQKAGALLTFCSIVLSAYMVALGLQLDGRVLAIASIGALAAGVAALYALSVVHLRWSRAETIRYRDLESACRFYYAVRAVRTTDYQIGWSIVAVAVAAVILFLAVSVICGVSLTDATA